MKKKSKPRSYVQKQAQFQRVDRKLADVVGRFGIFRAGPTPHEYGKASARRKRIHRWNQYVFPFMEFK